MASRRSRAGSSRRRRTACSSEQGAGGGAPRRVGPRGRELSRRVPRRGAAWRRRGRAGCARHGGRCHHRPPRRDDRRPPYPAAHRATGRGAAARERRADPHPRPDARRDRSAPAGVRRSEVPATEVRRSPARHSAPRSEPRRVCRPCLRSPDRPAARGPVAWSTPGCAERLLPRPTARRARRRRRDDPVAGADAGGPALGRRGARRRDAAHRVDGGRPRRHGGAAGARRGRVMHQPARDRTPGGGRVPEGGGGMSAGKVTVVGAGTMGHGIAYVAALAGFEVCLTDSRAEVLPRALGRLNDLLAVAVKRGKLTEPDRATAASRLRAEHQLAPAVSGAGVVIEAVHEHLGVKQQLFAELERAAPGDALLATNTSSLSITDIAAAVQEPGRVVGMHFFNPVHAMKLVEVVTHPRAAPAAVERAVALARALGKEPIVVQDSPGFASSRLGLALGLEAMRMPERGVASGEDIDKAMELGYNNPIGTVQLTDLVGLDVRLAIAEYLHHALGEPQFEPPQILRDKVAKGELGKKTGKGFYNWSA